MVTSIHATKRIAAFCLRWGGVLVVATCLLTETGQTAPATNWVEGLGYRYRDLEVPKKGHVHLTEIPPSETGVDFRGVVEEEKGAENTIRLGGSGVTAGDVDGDGWCDLFLCSMGGRCALYRNLGNWHFEDITGQAGIACEGQDSTGAVLVDVDGDGDLDLLINSIGGGTRLFLNDGKGHFTESRNCGLIRERGSTSLTLSDVDGNGTLDLYVANFATSKIEDHPNTRIQTTVVNGKPQIFAIGGVPITSPELTNRYFIDPAEHAVRERGEPDVFYLNDGHGKFTPVPWTEGTFLNEDGTPLAIPPYDWGLSAMFRDLNGDGAPDLYVCNDLFTPDRIWINEGNGHFRILSSLAVRQTSLFSMGIDFADINRDGYDDFLVVDMLTPDLAKQKVEIAGVKYSPLPVGDFANRPQYKRNTLFLNRGDATFAEVGQLSGVEATGWSWAPVFLDVDLDGFEDLLVSAGYPRDSLNIDAITQMKTIRGNRKLSDKQVRELKKLFPKLPQPCLAFRNRGDLTFEEKGRDWGFDFFGVTQGICLADLDNDGDLDVVVNRQNEFAGIYRNEAIAPRVAVRLKGRAANTRGVGAKIKFLGGPVPQSQEMICGGRYLSGDEPMRVFATGSATNGLRIEVIWRNGSRSIVTEVRPNRLYEIDEPIKGPSSSPVITHSPSYETNSWFQDRSALLNHTHHEEAYDDFARQTTLSRKLSQLGPGVCWFDVDGDGWEDLLIGTGKNGPLAVYLNDGQGVFTKWSDAPFNEVTTRDSTTVLGWSTGPNQRTIIAGLSNYEDGLANGTMLRTFDPRHKSFQESWPPTLSSVGPLALADIDGDGDLELFVGGRVVPGRYPEAADSLIFHRHGERLVLDQENSKRLSKIGMVSGAVFSDLDDDGLPELILACEWGPVRVFHNENGKLIEVTERLGLSRYLGWWNGVNIGDFDGDGKLDIVASNWGRNTKYQSYRAQPVRLYYGSAKETGVFVAAESSYVPALQKWLPWSSFATMAKAVPRLREQFDSHKTYGQASVTELFEDRLSEVKMVEANWLDTTVFLNRGDHFEAVSLPIESQFSPAFGISIADLDGDGAEDIFLSQNFAAIDNETSRYDGGRGLLLRGDGNGRFMAVPGQISGIQVYGDQRGCAVADYDGDGRVDLVVSQNGAATKLYKNMTAAPGLRIRLKVSDQTSGVGAVLRLVSNGRMGPARVIRAGSGYWSQDGAVQVMNRPAKIDQIWIRWPGGKTTLSAVPENAREIIVSSDGSVKKVR